MNRILWKFKPKLWYLHTHLFKTIHKLICIQYFDHLMNFLCRTIRQYRICLVNGGWNIIVVRNGFKFCFRQPSFTYFLAMQRSINSINEYLFRSLEIIVVLRNCVNGFESTIQKALFHTVKQYLSYLFNMYSRNNISFSYQLRLHWLINFFWLKYFFIFWNILSNVVRILMILPLTSIMARFTSHIFLGNIKDMTI